MYMYITLIGVYLPVQLMHPNQGHVTTILHNVCDMYDEHVHVHMH